MSKRLWINIGIVLAFLSIAVTGLTLYILPYNSLFAGIHIWAGLCFLVVSAFHISINYRPLLRYFRKRHSLYVVFSTAILMCLVIAAVKYRIRPVSSVLDFSSKIRKTAIVEETHSQTYIIDGKTTGKDFTIEVRAGEEFRVGSKPFWFGKKISAPPQFVFWLEDSKGRYLQTIFATARTGYPILHPKEKIKSNVNYRKEAFPYWLHKRSTAVDGITGATPHAHFNIRASTPDALNHFRVLAEVNRSFDFNEFYTEDKFPDDPIYSGDGFPGQPSVIYAVNVVLDSGDRTFVMKPIGHGHHSGEDGELYSDMKGIDSALNIFDRVLVQF